MRHFRLGQLSSPGAVPPIGTWLCTDFVPDFIMFFSFACFCLPLLFFLFFCFVLFVVIQFIEHWPRSLGLELFARQLPLQCDIRGRKKKKEAAEMPKHEQGNRNDYDDQGRGRSMENRWEGNWENIVMRCKSSIISQSPIRRYDLDYLRLKLSFTFDRSFLFSARP